MNSDVKQALVDLMKQNGGRLTPDQVVAEAKKKDSPLHTHFEWDVRKAAMSHWIDTARELIRSVRVVVHNETTTVRAPYFVRDPDARSKDQGYVALSGIRTESDQAREVMVDEFTRAASCLRRAKEISKVLQMEHEVEQVLSGVMDLRGRVSV